MRQGLTATEGRWVLRVNDLGANKAGALRLVQQITNWTLADVPRMLREGNPVFEGTLVEVESKEEQLKAIGVTVDKVRI